MINIQEQLETKIPTLLYHEIVDTRNKNCYAITSDDFANHLAFLQKDSYETLTVDDYLYSPGITSLPYKKIIITFDDGNESDCSRALPLLKKHRFKGNFFVSTGKIGSKGYLSEKQIKLLSATGMSIQSHGNDHVFLDGKLSSTLLDTEIRVSKLKLEEMLGKEVTCFSFPGGRFNLASLEFALKSGYRFVLSSIPSFPRKINGINVVGRQVVRYINNKANIEKLINEFASSKNLSVYWSKYALKKIMGNKLYHKLWSFYAK